MCRPARLTASDRVSAQNRIDDIFTTIHPQVQYGGVAQFGDKGGGSLGGALQLEMNILRSWLVVASRDQAEAIFMALRALSLAYADLPGRKTVVIFSEGFFHSSDAEREMRAAVDAANRAGVTFYVIDASGANSRMAADVRSPISTVHAPTQTRRSTDLFLCPASTSSIGRQP